MPGACPFGNSVRKRSMRCHVAQHSVESCVSVWQLYWYSCSCPPPLPSPPPPPYSFHWARPGSRPKWKISSCKNGLEQLGGPHVAQQSPVWTDVNSCSDSLMKVRWGFLFRKWVSILEEDWLRTLLGRCLLYIKQKRIDMKPKKLNLKWIQTVYFLL